MDPVIFTPRLKLTLVTTAELGSPEVDWFYELRKDEVAMKWSGVDTQASLGGASKSIEHAQGIMKNFIPDPDPEKKTYRVAYAVHKFLDSPAPTGGSETQPAASQETTTASASAAQGSSSSSNSNDRPMKFIGFMNLTPLNASSLVMPSHLRLPPTPDPVPAATSSSSSSSTPSSSSAPSTTLETQIAYYFLPHAWSQGYGTEAVRAMLDACARARETGFWAPHARVDVRAVINVENPGSERLARKAGFERLGTYTWKGEEPIWLAGAWHYEDNLAIWARRMWD